ncbi:MAG: ABC transporter ATP-binding protein [Acidimicrobiales bacterium]
MAEATSDPQADPEGEVKPALLDVASLFAGYLGENVVRSVSFSVAEREVVAMIGSNGAGKTTLFRAVCGLLRASRGTVTFDGRTISGRRPYAIARRGLAYVPADRHLFPTMSVNENLDLGAYPKRPRRERRELVLDLFPRLAERHRQQAGTLSGGEQQMLTVGRALMANPRVLLLDEPTTGLAPKLAAEAYAALAALRDHGLTIVVAEQQVPLALQLADRGYVLEDGCIQLDGTSAELAENPDVQRSYLGVA